MRRRWILVGAAVVAGSLTGCGNMLDPAAASVDGQRITVEQVQESLDRFEDCSQFEELTQQRDPDELKREYEQTLLSRLIRRKVLEREAAEAGVEVTAADVDERIDQIRLDFDSEKAFQNELKAQCVTLTEVRAFVRDSDLEQRLRARITEDVGPNEDDLRAEYESRAADFTEIDVSHILVGSQKRSGRIYDRLQRAPANKIDAEFAQLAEEFSTDPGSAEQGGDLGYLAPSDVVPEFGDTALALDEGEISEPVQSQFGWHIIRLNDTRVRPFEEARAQLAEEIGGQEQESAWQEFLEQAYADAGVEVNPRYGTLHPETQLVVNDDAGSVPGGQPQPEPTGEPSPRVNDPAADE